MEEGSRGMSLVAVKELKEHNEEMHMNNIADYRGWKEIEETIDSGACDIAMPVGMCADIPLHESCCQLIQRRQHDTVPDPTHVDATRNQ